MSEPSWVGKAEELDATEFNRLARSTTDPLLLYIGAPWCPPCKTMGPAFDAAAAAMGEQVRFLKVNAATDPQLLDSLKVAAVPMLLLYDEHGQELGRFLGALSASGISRWVQTRLVEARQVGVGTRTVKNRMQPQPKTATADLMTMRPSGLRRI